MSTAMHSPHPSLLKQLMSIVAIFLAVGVIAAAIWVISSAVIENMRFARGTSQMLRLISDAHTLAARDKNFATQPNEDILFDMMRIGLITDYTNGKPVALTNPWDGAVKSFSPSPLMIRIETDIPNHDCRRMALFFVKNSSDLGLKIIEVHGTGPAWQRFYAPADGINVSDTRAIEDACDLAPRVTLAFVVALH